jgi:hypothetical protein
LKANGLIICVSVLRHEKMNTKTFNNKESTVAILIVATISILFVAPDALTIPAYALGHWHEGDMENSGEDRTDTSATDERKELVSCLADTKEGSTPTQDEIKDCLNTVRGGEEDTEGDTSINDDDGITVRDDDPENSDTLNSIDGSSDTGDSTPSNADDE